jgi:hypothetical protein
MPSALEDWELDGVLTVLSSLSGTDPVHRRRSPREAAGEAAVLTRRLAMSAWQLLTLWFVDTRVFSHLHA